jgi:AraC-like DNA-binding protein
MIEIFIQTIAWTSILILILLSLFFILTPRGNKTQNYILVALLVVFIFQIFISLSLGNYGHKSIFKPHLYIYSLKLFSFIAGPLLFIYIKAGLRNNNVNLKDNLFHFIPFVAIMVFYSGYQFDIILVSSTNIYVIIAILAHSLLYIFFSFLIIKNNGIIASSLFTNLSEFSFNSWMRILLIGYFIIWLVQLNSLSIYVILKQPGWCAYSGSILALTILVISLFIMLLLLVNPKIYYFIKYKNNNISDSQKTRYLRKIDDFIHTDKPYLDGDITLQIIADKLSIQSRILSQVINESKNMDFKNYMNELRLKESIELLTQNSKNQKTIQEIYFMSGFNSRSVFNELFKRKTGMTPKEFRNKKMSGYK